MAYHADRNTMDVRIGDQLREREVECFQRMPFDAPGTAHHFMQRALPRLREGEVCVWFAGDDVPLIEGNAGRDNTDWIVPPGKEFPRYDD